MDTARALMRAQELDLEAGRLATQLESLPELREIAQRRRDLKRLRSELKHLVGLQKDLEIDIDDLDIDRANAERDVEAARSDQDASTEYRRVAELEERLGSLAKLLDKIAYEREGREAELADCRRRREALEGSIERLEKSILTAASDAREHALKLKRSLDEARSGAERALDSAGEDLAAEYRSLVAQKGGIAVERLDGDVPSACRMRLTEASLSDLPRGVGIARCPNCGRILIIEGDR